MFVCQDSRVPQCRVAKREDSINQPIKKLLMVSILSFLLIFSWGSKMVVYAWHTLTHPYLSKMALDSLPEEIRSTLTPYTEQIQWGAMAPDVTIKDWSNHELNIHGESLQNGDLFLNVDGTTDGSGDQDEDASVRISSLYYSITERLKSDPLDYSQIAYEMGLISHYIADICQPLHTDETAEEANFHVEYETDVYLWQENFLFEESGFHLVSDLEQYIAELAGMANRHYTGVSTAYAEEEGYEMAKGITFISLERSVQAIRDLWMSAWYESNLSTMNAVALHSNHRLISHGQTIQITLSTLLRDSALIDSLPDKSDPLADAGLYVAMVDPSGVVWFLMSDSRFSQSVRPWKSLLNSRGETESLKSDLSSELIILDGLIWPKTAEGEYSFYAAILSQYPSASAKSFDVLSNVAQLTVNVIKSTTFSLSDLADETYLFPAVDEESNAITPLPLQRWDFIVIGDRKDIPISHGDESQHSNLIPGRYNHLMIYLGRDNKGVPYGMEMTTFFDPDGYDLRPARLPEYELFDDNSEALPLPVVSKSLWSHATRWAMRLTEENLVAVRQREPELIASLEKEWLERLNYQVEYEWSGDSNDTTVYLVDDGVERGAGCTDYWLSFFEDHAGVCIKGSRISAEEIVNYFKSDPLGREAIIPEELNPFPFSLYVRDLFSMGFNLANPEPHLFSCDGSSETGISIPSRLLHSPQLEEISPAPTVYDWP